MTTGGDHRVEQGAWAEELGALEVLEEVEEEDYWEQVINILDFFFSSS